MEENNINLTIQIKENEFTNDKLINQDIVFKYNFLRIFFFLGL